MKGILKMNKKVSTVIRIISIIVCGSAVLMHIVSLFNGLSDYLYFTQYPLTSSEEIASGVLIVKSSFLSILQWLYYFLVLFGIAEIINIKKE